MLRSAILDRSIVDDNNMLSHALEDITSLEKSLLQANADAMQIASKIIRAVEGETS